MRELARMLAGLEESEAAAAHAERAARAGPQGARDRVAPTEEGNQMTAVFDLSDRVVEGTAASDPVAATFMGVAGYDTRLTDYRRPPPTGGRPRSGPGSPSSMPCSRPTPPTGSPRHTFAERLSTRVLLHDSGENLRDCNVIGSPVQYPRQAFTLFRPRARPTG